MLVRDLQFDRNEHFDLILGVCGYEPRASYVCRLGVSATTRLAAIYKATTGETFEQNRQAFSGEGWDLVDVANLESELDVALANVQHPRILVDISSMPRHTMARLVRYFWTSETVGVVQFMYAPARFESSSAAANVVPSLTAGPLSDYFAGALRSPSIPVGLVLGLGLEPHRASGLVELIEPTRLWAFAALSDDDRFTDELGRMHAALLGNAGGSMLLHYDIRSLAEIYNAIESLVFSASLDYRLLIAPSGPKIFSLASLLAGTARTPTRPAIWRVGSAAPTSYVSTVIEAGDIIAAEVDFADVSTVDAGHGSSDGPP